GRRGAGPCPHAPRRGAATEHGCARAFGASRHTAQSCVRNRPRGGSRGWRRPTLMPQLFRLLLLALIPAIGPSTPGRTPDQVRPGEAMTIVQLQYDGGGDWYANPSALPNLLRFIRERANLPVETRPVTLKLTDPAIWSYPYLYLTGHGNIRFTDEEVEILRRYLTSGGFLHADDNCGLDERLRREVRRAFPRHEPVERPVPVPDWSWEHPVHG